MPTTSFCTTPATARCPTTPTGTDRVLPSRSRRYSEARRSTPTTSTFILSEAEATPPVRSFRGTMVGSIACQHLRCDELFQLSTDEVRARCAQMIAVPFVKNLVWRDVPASLRITQHDSGIEHLHVSILAFHFPEQATHGRAPVLVLVPRDGAPSEIDVLPDRHCASLATARRVELGHIEGQDNALVCQEIEGSAQRLCDGVRSLQISGVQHDPVIDIEVEERDDDYD